MCAHVSHGAIALREAQPEHVFTPVYRGLSTPPPLGLHVEFRPESAPRCFFAMWADGTVMAVCRTIADAQQALADARGQGGTE